MDNTLSNQVPPEASLQEGNIDKKRRLVQIDIPFSDDSTFPVKVPAQLFKMDFSREEISDYIRDAFREQYDMPWTEKAQGFLQQIQSGLTFNIASGDEVVNEKFDMLYPKTSDTAYGVGMALPVAGSMLANPAGGTATLATALARSPQSAGKVMQEVYKRSPYLQGLAQSAPTTLAARNTSLMKDPFAMTEGGGGFGFFGRSPGSMGVTGKITEGAVKGAGLGGLAGAGADWQESGLEGLDMNLEEMGIGAGIGGALPLAASVAKGAVNLGQRLGGADKRVSLNARESILSSMQDENAKIAARLGNAERNVRLARGEDVPPARSEAEYRSLFEANQVDQFGNVIPVSPTVSLDMRTPNTKTMSLLTERMGGGKIDPETGATVGGSGDLQYLYDWANFKGNYQMARRIEELLRERGSHQSSQIAADIRREFKEPLKFSSSRALNELEGGLQKEYDALYNQAYYEQTAEGGLVPRYVGLGSKKGEDGLFLPSLAKTLDINFGRQAYKEVLELRQARRVLSNNTPEYVDGVSTELPDNFDDFINGVRYISKSSWGRNKAALLAKGWKLKEGGRQNTYTIQNKNASVDVETAHQFRRIIAEESKRLYDSGKNVKAGVYAQLSDRINAVLAGTKGAAKPLREGDELFKRTKDAQDAASIGNTFWDDNVLIGDVQEKLSNMSPEASKHFRIRALEVLKDAEKYSAEDILSSQALRVKLKSLLKTDMKPKEVEVAFGRILARLSSTQRQSLLGNVPTEKVLPKESKTMDTYYRMVAKIPAYKFSQEFAAARDLVELGRKFGAEENRILAREVQAILGQTTIKGMKEAAEDLAETYKKQYPNDAHRIRQFAAILNRLGVGELTKPDRENLFDSP